MRPPSTRTTGLAPPDAGDATALPVPAATTVAATPTADTANNAARRTRRVRVVFMLSPLPGPVGTVFGLVLRFVNCGTPRASSRHWYGHWSPPDAGAEPGSGHACRGRIGRSPGRPGYWPGFLRGHHWRPRVTPGPASAWIARLPRRCGTRAPRAPGLETPAEAAGQCPSLGP